MENKRQKMTPEERRMKTAWYCEICNNGKNYTSAGKTNHLKTQKHQMKEELEHLWSKVRPLLKKKDLHQLSIDMSFYHMSVR